MNPLSKLEYGGGNRHTPVYCNRKFKVKGKEFTYLEADYGRIGDYLGARIWFTDGVKRFCKSEVEFFKAVSL